MQCPFLGQLEFKSADDTQQSISNALYMKWIKSAFLKGLLLRSKTCSGIRLRFFEPILKNLSAHQSSAGKSAAKAHSCPEPKNY